MRNNKIKALICLALALLSVIGLYGCGEAEPIPGGSNLGGGGNQQIELPPLDGGEEEGGGNSSTTPSTGNERTSITHAELAQAKIVIPANAMLLVDAEGNPGYLYSEVCRLQNTLKLIQGIELNIVQDNQGADSEFEILIGETDREESTKVLGAEMALNDYGYAICNTKIVIRGGSDPALKQAISSFIQNVVSRKNKNFYERSMDTVTRKTYLAKDMTVNGALLSDYAIVYPAQSDLYEQELAERLADRLQVLTGKTIKRYSDAKAYDSSVREILIGSTNRPFAPLTQNAAAYEGDASFVAVVGTNAYELGLAETALQEMIERQCALGNKVLSVTSAVTAAPETTVSLMGYNINGTTAALYEERVGNLCRKMNKYLPDILVFQEPAQNMMDLIHMEDYYGYYLGIPRHGADVPSLAPGWNGANSYAPILYAKDRYEVIEGGTKWMTATPDVVSKIPDISEEIKSDYYRIYTYVLFLDKVTDERFLVVNHHLDFNSQIQVETMKYMFKFLNQTYTGVPVIMAGDFNATQSAPVIEKLIVGAAGFSSAHLLTTNIGHNATSGVIDFIFVTPCCVDVKYFTMCHDTYPDMTKAEFDNKMPSDHPATYAELSISSKKQCTHNWNAAVNYTYQASAQ